MHNMDLYDVMLFCNLFFIKFTSILLNSGLSWFKMFSQACNMEGVNIKVLKTPPKLAWFVYK